MADLTDGQRVEVQGSGSNRYTLSRDGRVYSCSCPAWRNMRVRIEERRCKHLIAYLGNTLLALPPSAAPVRPVVVLAPPRPVHVDAPEVREMREAALASALDGFLVLADKMEEVYGLRLPSHLAYGAGFYLGLTAEERAEFAKYVGPGLVGVGAWFAGADLERAPFGDERLRDRLPGDPPELVSVFAGKPGERWGLWYDDPKELPTSVARRVVAAPGEPVVPPRVHLCYATLLATLRTKVVLTEDVSDGDTRNAIVTWLDEVAGRDRASIGERSPIPAQRTGWILGEEMNPYVPDGNIPVDLVGQQAQRMRKDAYARRDPSVRAWVAEALAELTHGSVMRALFLGRELHGLDAEEWRYECTELLLRAYAALGRRALAEIVVAQYRALHPSLKIYELPAPHPVIAAASGGDAEDLLRALEEGGEPTDEELEHALVSAQSVDALDALLDNASGRTLPPLTESAISRQLTAMLRAAVGSEDRARRSAILNRLVQRGSVNARALERILAAGEPLLLASAVARVDLTSTQHGATVLHLAVKAAAPDVVRALLERGADPRAKNAAGRLAYDTAREVWLEKRREATDIFAMLEAAGGGVAKAPSFSSGGDPSWKPGEAVVHPKFGDGVVKAVTGAGDETKLQIRFGKDEKVLLARFVARA